MKTVNESICLGISFLECKILYLHMLQIGETFKHTIEEIEDIFINSDDPEDVKLREKLSKNLPIKQSNPIL